VARGSAYEVTRSWRVAFLLPSLLASMLTLALTYDLGRRLWNRRAGLYAAGAVLCVFQFMYQMKRAQIDPLVTFWITLANWGLLRHLLCGPDWRAYWLGCFAAGLGVITKGVGVLALLMLAALRVRARARLARRRAHRARDAALAGRRARVPRGDRALARAHGAVGEGARRAEYDAYMQRHSLQADRQALRRFWSHASRSGTSGRSCCSTGSAVARLPGLVPQWWRDLRAGDARLLLPLAWFAMVLVFFSIPSGKRDVYLLPALPMVALAAAPYLERLVQTRWLRMAAFLVTLGGGLVIVGAGARTLHGSWPVAQKFLERRETGRRRHHRRLAGAGRGVVMLLSAAWFRVARGVHALLAGVAVFWLIWSLGVYPVLNDSSSARGSCAARGADRAPTPSSAWSRGRSRTCSWPTARQPISASSSRCRSSTAAPSSGSARPGAPLDLRAREVLRRLRRPRQGHFRRPRQPPRLVAVPCRCQCVPAAARRSPTTTNRTRPTRRTPSRAAPDPAPSACPLLRARRCAT
jgi:4-amino-4-deoxy-L-arabinose transferase-like glycosyltransferase